MKALILKNYLKEALSFTERVSSKNQSLPILGDVLIVFEKGQLILKATNLEMGIEINLPAKTEGNGSLAIPSQVIYSFISNLLGDDHIRIEGDNYNLHLNTTSTNTIIKGHSIEDFPVFPKIQSPKTIQIEAQNLFTGLKSVWYAASLSQMKPEISSVYLVTKKKEVFFVATDSFRLAEKHFPWEGPDIPGILIPYKSVVEIIRITDGKTGPLKLSFDKNQLLLSLGAINFITRLTEGSFPDYEQIIPKNFKTDAVVDKQTLTNTLKSSSVFVNKLNEINLSLTGEEEVMIIKSFSPETGEHLARMPVKKTGEDVIITMNHKQLTDCLPYIVSQDILLRFSGKDRPILLTGATNTTFQYLVMPIRNT